MKIRYISNIFWLLFLVALVYGAVQFSVPREVNAQTGDTVIRYTVEFGERFEGNVRRVIRAGFHENIVVGEAVFDSQRGLHMGTVVEVYALPFEVEAADKDAGLIRRARVEGLETVRIVVEARAHISDYETLVGLVPVSVGREAFVRSKYFAGAGYVIAVERVG